MTYPLTNALQAQNALWVLGPGEDGAGNITTLNVSVMVAILVELRVLSNLISLELTSPPSLETLRAEELTDLFSDVSSA